MSTIGRQGRDILKFAQMSEHEKFLENEKRRKRDEEREFRRQESFEQLKQRAKTQTGDVEALIKRLGRGKRHGSRSEFASSIPDGRSTIAPMVSRGGFQSPNSSPPTTPRKGPTLVRTETPVWEKRIGDPPKALPVTPEPRKRPGKKKIYTDKPKVTTRAKHAARAKAKKPSKLAPVHSIDISGDTDTDVETVTDEKAQESAPTSAVQSATESESEEAEWDPTTVYAPKGVRARLTPLLAAHRIRGIAKPTTNMAGFRALRAKQKKARKEFKRARVQSRHKLQTHTPFVPKLQINQKGPGQFQVRSTGVTGAVKNQVKTLLDRVKGKLFVNGKFTAPKRAYAVIIALLVQKQVINIQLK